MLQVSQSVSLDDLPRSSLSSFCECNPQHSLLYMYQMRNILPFLKSRKEKEEKLSNFCKNGSLVLEELIVTFGERYKLPIRRFTPKELISATKIFSEKGHRVISDNNGYISRGNLQGRPVLVKFDSSLGYSYKKEVNESIFNETKKKESILNGAIRDIVITSQMSHQKNVVKLIGCSLEFKYPAMVYEYPGTELLLKCLEQPNKLLSWKSRIKIASDIANVMVYLHTAFPTPIIFRDLTPGKVIIDQCGIAKLYDFTASIPLPPGELQVKDEIVGTYGYADPQYTTSGFVTQKTDVYSLGVLVLVLITGETATVKYNGRKGERVHLVEDVKFHLKNDQFSQIVDPWLIEKEGTNVSEKHLLDILVLALRCTEYEGIDRPDMIDVAKKLLEIEKSVRCC